MRLRVDGDARHPLYDLARERIEPGNVLHLVIEQLDAHRLVLGLRREHIDHLATHPVVAPLQLGLVAGVLQFRQPPHDVALVHLLAPGHVQDHAQVGLRVTQAVDGRHRRDDDRIRALQQRLGRGQAHLLNVLIHRGVLLDEGIRRRHIGFRLVIVVIGDEVLHRVVREELPELTVELRRQRLVVRHDHGRALHLLDHLGHGERLAGTGNAQQRLVHQAVMDALDQGFDRPGLVPRRLEIRGHPERQVVFRHRNAVSFGSWGSHMEGMLMLS